MNLNFLCLCLDECPNKYAALSGAGVVWGGEIISLTCLINIEVLKKAKSSETQHLWGVEWGCWGSGLRSKIDGALSFHLKVYFS